MGTVAETETPEQPRLSAPLEHAIGELRALVTALQRAQADRAHDADLVARRLPAGALRTARTVWETRAAESTRAALELGHVLDAVDQVEHAAVPS